MTTRRVSLIALPAALMLGLGGCSLLEATVPDEPLTGVAACALGHSWSVDLDGLATQVLAELGANGVAATGVVAAGSHTLDWSVTSDVELSSDYSMTITVPAADGQVLTVVQSANGVVTGKAYISGTVAIPRDWDSSGLEVSTVADIGGVAQETVPIIVPKIAFDDGVGLELTCDAETMTIHPRGGVITQTWTRTD